MDTVVLLQGGSERLSKLSTEILTHILQYLNAMDVLNVRKINRALHKATKIRSVWLALLDRACARYGMFKPTFPMDEMSALELEDASTAPFKFMRSIKRVDEGDYPLPYYTRVLQFHSGSGSTGKLPGYEAETVHLVPGARFLLTTGTWYCLWDIGFKPGSAARPFPIAEALYHEDSTFGTLIPSQDGNAVVLGTSQYNRMNRSRSFFLQKIDLTTGSGGKPRFQPIATLAVGIVLTVSFLFLSETVAVLWANPYIVVWDWPTRSLCKWSPAGPHFPLQCNIRALVSCQTLFIWDDNNNLQVFDLPTAYAPCPSGNIRDVAPIVNRPKSETPTVCADNMIVSSTTTWQSTFSAGQYACTVLPDNTSFRLYSVKNSGAKNDPFLPRSLLVPAGKSDTAYYGAGLTSLRRFEEELVLCSRSPDDVLIVMVMPVPTGACLDEMTLFLRPLTRYHAIHPDDDEEERLGHQFDFCPFSGRTVYIGQNHDVFVSDYVLPSYEA